VTFTSRTTLGDELWSEWKFDEGSGTTAADSTGLTVNGTLTNQPQWSQGFDGRGGLTFSGFQAEGGSNAYVTMGNPSDRSLDFGSDSFSIALWVKYTDVSIPAGQNGRRIISKGDYGFNPGYTIVLEGTGQLYTGIGSTLGDGSQALFFHTVSEYNDGKWHHVAAVFDRQDSTARIYVDGVAQALVKDANSGGTVDPQAPTVISYPDLTTLSATSTDMPLTVSSHMGVYDFFKGDVDNVRFYRKAIGGPEVAALYNTDTDGNGLPDRWEWEQFGQSGVDPATDSDGDGLTNLQEYLAGSDPKDFFNGLPPALTIVDGNNQGDFPGLALARPFAVRVTNQNGTPKPNAPVIFSIQSGGGQLSPVNGGITDASGIARASLQLPSTVGTTVLVDAAFSEVKVIFTATVGNASLAPAGPSDVACERQSPIAVLVKWTDNSNNETAFYVERSEDNQVWQRLLPGLPANTTEFLDEGLAVDGIYSYRIVAHNNAP
jgi:hypothetical protein